MGALLLTMVTSAATGPSSPDADDPRIRLDTSNTSAPDLGVPWER